MATDRPLDVLYNYRRYLVRVGRASWWYPYKPLSVALQDAGLEDEQPTAIRRDIDFVW